MSVVRRAARLVAPVVWAGLAAGCGPARNAPAAGAALARGGELVASVHTDPRTLNPIVTAARDSTTNLVTRLTHAKLVRLNHATDSVEPWLADSWTRTPDGLSYTIKLRPDVTFSDGHVFTSDDVLFSFEAAYDDRVGSALSDSLTVGGKRLQVVAPDPLTVVVRFPGAFAPGVRILDSLPVLPRHKLGAALKNGTFAQALGLGTPLDQLVGLGPFVVTDYAPGQRLVFGRNRHYWRRDANGASLPYLDRITVEIDFFVTFPVPVSGRRWPRVSNAWVWISSRWSTCTIQRRLRLLRPPHPEAPSMP